jgi:hypothetical protein
MHMVLRPLAPPAFIIAATRHVCSLDGADVGQQRVESLHLLVVDVYIIADGQLLHSRGRRCGGAVVAGRRCHRLHGQLTTVRLGTVHLLAAGGGLVLTMSKAFGEREEWWIYFFRNLLFNILKVGFYFYCLF